MYDLMAALPLVGEAVIVSPTVSTCITRTDVQLIDNIFACDRLAMSEQIFQH
jgi:hypothetical protein